MAKALPELTPLDYCCFLLGFRIRQFQVQHDTFEEGWHTKRYVSEIMFSINLTYLKLLSNVSLGVFADPAKRCLDAALEEFEKRTADADFDPAGSEVARKLLQLGQFLRGGLESDSGTPRETLDWFDVGQAVANRTCNLVCEDYEGPRGRVPSINVEPEWNEPERLDQLLARVGMSRGDLMLPPGEWQERVWRFPEHVRENHDLWPEVECFVEDLGRAVVNTPTARPRIGDAGHDAVGEKLEKPTGQDEPSGRKTLSKWSELCIGVDAGGTRFYAFAPCPPPGAVVDLADATELEIGKNQLASILLIFAKPDNGNTASCRELRSKLAPGPRIGHGIARSRVMSERGMGPVKLEPQFTRAMASAGKQFREKIATVFSVMDETPTFRRNGDKYLASFFVRDLLCVDGVLRLGRT